MYKRQDEQGSVVRTQGGHCLIDAGAARNASRSSGRVVVGSGMVSLLGCSGADVGLEDGQLEAAGGHPRCQTYGVVVVMRDSPLRSRIGCDIGEHST